MKYQINHSFIHSVSLPSSLSLLSSSPYSVTYEEGGAAVRSTFACYPINNSFFPVFSSTAFCVCTPKTDWRIDSIRWTDLAKLSGLSEVAVKAMRYPSGEIRDVFVEERSQSCKESVMEMSVDSLSSWCPKNAFLVISSHASLPNSTGIPAYLHAYIAMQAGVWQTSS